MRIIAPIRDWNHAAAQLSVLEPYLRCENVAVVLLHVIEQDAFAYSRDFQTVGAHDWERQKKVRAFLNQVKDWIHERAPNVEVEKLVIEGDFDTELLKLANALPADLIVMAGTTRSSLLRLISPSRCEQVMRKLNCACLVGKLSKAAVPFAFVRKERGKRLSIM